MTEPFSSTPAKVTVTNAKIEVEKFGSRNNFDMWQCDVLNILYQQKLDVALEEVKSDKITDIEWERINLQVCDTI